MYIGEREGGGGTLKAFSFAVNGWPGSSFAHWTLWLGLLMPTWHTIFYYFSCKEHTAPAEFCYHHPKNPLQLQLYPNAILNKNQLYLASLSLARNANNISGNFMQTSNITRFLILLCMLKSPLLCNTISWGILRSIQSLERRTVEQTTFRETKDEDHVTCSLSRT